MRRRITMWTNRSVRKRPNGARRERMRDAQKVRGPRGWVGFGMELETKGTSWTGGERLDATGAHSLYVCVNAASVVRLCTLYTRRERPEESVSQSVSRSRRVAHGCAPRSRTAVLLLFSFYFSVFHFMRCFDSAIEKLDRETCFDRSPTGLSFTFATECATPSVSEIFDRVRIFYLFHWLKRKRSCVRKKIV